MTTPAKQALPRPPGRPYGSTNKVNGRKVLFGPRGCAQDSPLPPRTPLALAEAVAPHLQSAVVAKRRAGTAIAEARLRPAHCRPANVPGYRAAAATMAAPPEKANTRASRPS